MNAPLSLRGCFPWQPSFNYQISAGANFRTERHVYAVRAQNALTAFLNEKRLRLSKFWGVTPATQYSLNLTAEHRSVKRTKGLRVSRTRGTKLHFDFATRPYLTSTVAPASVSFCLMVSASSFEIPSLTALGAASTRSFASFRPNAVTSRTTLMTLILLPPAA